MANSAPKGSSTIKFDSFSPNKPYTISESQLLQGFSDDDGDKMKAFMPLIKEGQGTVEKKDGGFLFTPAKDFTGKVTIVYHVHDYYPVYQNGKYSSQTSGFVDTSLSFDVGNPVALKPVAEIFKANGYYSTFADLAKAAYHLASEEQLHSGQTLKNSGEVHGQGENYIKPYADETWARVAKDWSVLKNTDLNMPPSGVIEGIGDDDTWYIESDGVYHSENAAAFAVRSGDAVVISFRGTNDNDNEGTPFFGTDAGGLPIIDGTYDEQN